MFERNLYSSSLSPKLKLPQHSILGLLQHYWRPQDMTSIFRNNHVTLIIIIIMSLHYWFPDSRTRPPGRRTSADVCQADVSDRLFCKDVIYIKGHFRGGFFPCFMSLWESRPTWILGWLPDSLVAVCLFDEAWRPVCRSCPQFFIFPAPIKQLTDSSPGTGGPPLLTQREKAEKNKTCW